MTFEQRLQTVDDLHDLAELPENAGKRFELIRGAIYEVAAPTPTHAYISNKFGRFLDEYAEETGNGYAFGDSCSYTLSEHNELIPDASFISKQRLPDPPLPSTFALAPDLAVEVVSPNDNSDLLMTRVQKYLQHGTEQVWVLYPTDRMLLLYRSDQPDTVKIYREDNTLSPESLFPGLNVPVKALFALPKTAAK